MITQMNPNNINMGPLSLLINGHIDRQTGRHRDRQTYRQKGRRTDRQTDTLCLCVGLYVSVCLCVCPFVSISLSVCLSDSLSVCLTVCVSVCLFVCLSVCLLQIIHFTSPSLPHFRHCFPKQNETLKLIQFVLYFLILMGPLLILPFRLFPKDPFMTNKMERLNMNTSLLNVFLKNVLTMDKMSSLEFV